jgi:O-antigen ligase
VTENVSSRNNRYFIFLSVIFLITIITAVISSIYSLAFISFACLLFYFGWQHGHFIFYLLIFSLPWSIEYNFNSSLGTDLPDEPLMWLATVLFLSWLVLKPSDLIKKYKHLLLFLLLINFTWIVISVLFSTDWLLSLKFLLAKTWYLIAFVFVPVLFFVNKRSLRIAALILIASMFMITAFTVARHATHGFKFANINDAVIPFFRNHVNYSAMLVCTMPIMVATYQLNKKYRWVIAAAMMIELIALFFSYARGAWLALLIGLISYWLIKKRILLITFTMVIAVIIASVFWISRNDRYLEYAHDYKTTIFHENFEEHLVATYKLKDVSTAERFNRWIAGVRMIKDNWLTGYGPTTFYYNYKPYAIPAFKTWVSDNKEHSTVHNFFLLTLIEQGIFGLLIFLIIAGSLLYYAEKIYVRSEEKFYKVTAMTCGVMITMIMVVNFLSDLIETDKIGSLFFLCLATLVAIDGKEITGSQ